MTIYIRLSRAILTETINQRSSDLKKLSLDIHAHPETAFEEVFAHSAISDLLESNGFEVTRGAYGVPTSFEAQVGTGGRLVIFCAEYDALPQIGHGCGHNLIAMSSIAGFIAAAEWLRQSGTPGRVRLLGCPAEESGGGKAKLIDAGAFKDDVAAAIMAHPVTEQSLFNGPSGGQSGLAGLKLNARHMFNTEFRGKAAHAAAEPWNGLNAFDAAVAAYNNVGLLRQQIEPTDRIHAIMEVGGTVANVIPDYTRMSWMVRSPTVERADQLLLRVKDCIRAGASAAGCELNYIESPTYMNLTCNKTLCETYVEEMAQLGHSVMLQQEKQMSASTDMGNVGHVVPSFHGAFVISTSVDAAVHSPQFADAAAKDEALEAALACSKGLAAIAMRVLVDDKTAGAARSDFDDNHGW